MPAKPVTYCTEIAKSTGKPCQRKVKAGNATCKSHSGDSDVGRRWALTPEVKAKLVGALEAGNYRETSAAYAGIHKSSLFAWLAQGRQDKEAGTESVLADLVDAVEKAEAATEVYAVLRVREAMKDSWQAAMTYLERKKPDEWGRRERHQVDHQGAVSVTGSLFGEAGPASVDLETRRKIADLIQEGAKST